jgi:CDP-diacylglycerol--glycerol-3-phosphate 3-phosphatidyltransferase
MARLAVSLVVFVLLHFKLFLAALIAFVVAASTDWIDGRLARRMGLVSQIGRVMDPLADKIVVCGAFIFLCAEPGSQILPWMAVVVVGRELVVTVIRSFLEQHGKDFSANMPGKLKMVFQCFAVVGSLWLLRQLSRELTIDPWVSYTVVACVWLAVLSTLYSGWIYMVAAGRLMREL